MIPSVSICYYATALKLKPRYVSVLAAVLDMKFGGNVDVHSESTVFRRFPPTGASSRAPLNHSEVSDMCDKFATDEEQALKAAIAAAIAALESPSAQLLRASDLLCTGAFKRHWGFQEAAMAPKAAIAAMAAKFVVHWGFQEALESPSAQQIFGAFLR